MEPVKGPPEESEPPLRVVVLDKKKNGVTRKQMAIAVTKANAERAHAALAASSSKKKKKSQRASSKSRKA
jgi:hypothetical protein